VTSDYTATTSRFIGKIHWVQLDVGTDDHDHFIDPDERLPHRHGLATTDHRLTR
jgi:arylsulfatase